MHSFSWSHLRPKIPISAHLMQACNNYYRDVGWSERLKCTISILYAFVNSSCCRLQVQGNVATSPVQEVRVSLLWNCLGFTQIPLDRVSTVGFGGLWELAFKSSRAGFKTATTFSEWDVFKSINWQDWTLLLVQQLTWQSCCHCITAILNWVNSQSLEGK